MLDTPSRIMSCIQIGDAWLSDFYWASKLQTLKLRHAEDQAQAVIFEFNQRTLWDHRPPAFSEAARER